MAIEIDWTEYDWAAAIAMASGGEDGQGGSLSADDVDYTVAASAGENDESDWLAIVKLKDGRFAYISAWCDYTGWDCRSGGEVAYADTLTDLCRLNMDDGQRARLGVDVFGEKS